MPWLRTITGFVRVLVALFAVSQFMGVVSSPTAGAQGVSTAVARHLDYHRAEDDGGVGAVHRHDDQSKDGVDKCCALHAFFGGILPAAVAVDIGTVSGKQLASDFADIGPGIASDRLDRPPKPHAMI